MLAQRIYFSKEFYLNICDWKKEREKQLPLCVLFWLGFLAIHIFEGVCSNHL